MSITYEFREGDERLTLEQRAEPRSFLGLSLKNGLLNIVTLTLYRFWGKTEVRRRLWSTTFLNDEPLEYTGRGVELFLGFVFALAAVGLPVLLATFGAQLLGPWVFLAALIPIYLLLLFLMSFGTFSAFRYMSSRTRWRGVRFQLHGSATPFAWRYLGYVLLSGITGGWYWPAASRRLGGALWSSLSFGDQRFRFDIQEARDKAPVYPAYFIAVAITGVATQAFGSLANLVVPDAQGATEPSLLQFAAIYGLLAAMAFVIAIGFAPYRAAHLRTLAAGVRLGGLRFRLDLTGVEMIKLTAVNLLLVTLTLGFLMPFVQARTSRFLISRLETSGMTDLASAKQAPRGPETGEGLADAFGFSPV